MTLKSTKTYKLKLALLDLVNCFKTITIVFGSLLLSAQLALANNQFKLAFEIAPPFTYYDEQNQLQGVALDLVSALVDKIDGELSYVTCPWARCMRLVESGKADFVFGIVKTKERQKKLIYIEPAFTHSFTEIGFYQLKNRQQPITKVADLEQLTIGVQRGALHFEEFDNNPNIKKVAVVDIVSIIELLKKGRIDAFVMPKQSAEKYLEQNDSEQLISSAEFVHKVKQGGYVALSKKSGHQDKVKALNKAMKQLKDSGQLKQILAKYKLSL